MEVKPKSAGEGPQGLSRRELLNYFWLSSLGLLSLEIGILLLRYGRPPGPSGTSGSRVELGPAERLLAATPKPQRPPRQRFWWLMTEEGVLALSQACPHLGCALEWDDAAGLFVCPCHASQFAPDGTCLTGPAPRGMDRLIVRALDAQGREVARTDGSARPVLIPPGSTVVVETGTRLPGPPRVVSGPLGG